MTKGKQWVAVRQAIRQALELSEKRGSSGVRRIARHCIELLRDNRAGEIPEQAKKSARYYDKMRQTPDLLIGLEEAARLVEQNQGLL
jgi:hypothetical protein